MKVGEVWERELSLEGLESLESLEENHPGLRPPLLRKAGS
jgi:hypothetical protein